MPRRYKTQRPICEPMQTLNGDRENYFEPTRLEEAEAEGRVVAVLGGERPRVAVFIDRRGFIAISQIEGGDDIHASVLVDPRDAKQLSEALLKVKVYDRNEKANASTSGRRRRRPSRAA